MTYTTEFTGLSHDELIEIDGGGFGAGIWTVIKVCGAIAGVGAGGVVVGAGVIIGTYYTCKWIFG